MAEQSRQDSKDQSRNKRGSPLSQRSPWFLQNQESVHPFAADPSHAQPQIFPLQTLQSNVPDHHGMLQHYLTDANNCPQVSEEAIDRVHSAGRPGTPALPQTDFKGVYDDMSNQSSFLNDEHGFSTRNVMETTSPMSRTLPDRRNSDLCQQQQAPQFGSFFVPGFQGNHARSIEVCVIENHQQEDQLSASFPLHSNNGHQQNIRQNFSQCVGEHVSQSYQFRQAPSINPLPDLEVNPLANYNFNDLHHNMVRLKNGVEFDDKNKQSIAPNEEKCLEDDEGNHECHNLRQRSAETNSDQEHNPVSSLSHLPDTPTIGRIGVNHFAALGASIYQGEWPLNRALWMSGPSSIGETDSLRSLVGDDTESIMSFSSSTASARHSHPHQLGTKVEMVYSLLSMLGSSNRDDMSRTLLEMSNNRESCIAMRQSGCLPLLVQLLHGTDHDLLSDQDPNTLRWVLREARRRAGQALHNIVYAHPDDKRGRREARVLRLLEQIRDYSDYLKDVGSGATDITQNENLDFHPGPAIAALMKLSFDEEHRHAMCLLGGLQAIAELIQIDHEVHENTNDQFCITVRRYAGMALTNLTFGDGTNKALLCSMKPFMQALVAQLHSSNEDLRQVTASVLRNLSWRADAASKQILREVDAVVTLMKTAMETGKESTLKSILSALWNLSAHCSVNKADICAIQGALEFLVSTLTYKSLSKTLSIVENGGGILRNVSSHIAVKEEYRAILRKHNCLQTLLRHLKSPSLTVVSNACGTLWNLSARCQQDQQSLWEMGAVGMLRNLIHSKHKMISMGSAAALKNLLAARPPGMGLGLGNSVENGHYQNSGSQNSSPSLLVRKQRALEADIDQNLSETCDNIDSPKTSPSPSSGKKFTFDNNGMNKPQYLSYLPGRMYHSVNGHVTSPLYVPRSESRDSLGSTRSEPPHYKAQCERFRIFVNTNRHLPLEVRALQEKPSEWKEKINLEQDDNTNIVMQLFQSLHSNAHSNNSSNSNILSMSTKPSKSNNLTPVKRGAWEVPCRNSSKIENKNIPPQNGCHYNDEIAQRVQQALINDDRLSHTEESQLNVSPRQNSKSQEIVRNVESSALHPDVDVFCNFPDNRRPAVKDRPTHNILNFSENLKITQCSNTPCMDNFYRNDTTNTNGIEQAENIRSLKYPMDTIQEHVVLRKKAKDDISHWSSTSTLKDSEEISLDHTPLAVSRCSSLSSLGSCMQQSARSSWISDVSSRRTSGVISPSEIPESPSDMKLHMSQFTDKAPDAETLGIPRPRPAWPCSVSSTMSTDSITSMTKNLTSETKTSDLQKVSSRQEKLVVICDREIGSDDNLQKLHQRRSPSILGNEICSNTMCSSSSEKYGVSQSEGELPGRDESLHIPNNTSCNTQHNNNNKLISRVNNLSSSFSYMKSGIPVKSNNVRLSQSVPNVSRSHTLASCAIGLKMDELEDEMNSIGKSDVPQKSELDTVCDDNDNLLIKNADKKQSDVNLSFSNFSEIQMQLETLPDKLVCHIKENSFDETTKINEQTDIESENLVATCNLPSSSPSSDHSDSLPASYFIEREKNIRKVKTSIPQIVRPWHPTLDSDVHPKQLQVMSQNLPVYRGSCAIHYNDKEEKRDETYAPETKSLKDTRQSDPSSVSADSEVSSAELLQDGSAMGKPSRTKTKRNKLFRRSTEIPTPEHSSDEDNQNNTGEAHVAVDRLPSIQYSEEEEKGKEDERRKEKFKELLLIGNNIPDLLEGATFHADFATKREFESRTIAGVKVNGSSLGMTDSMELRKGAFMIAAELDELADDHTHSSTSCFSDLDNIKPPSVMGEMSMTSSGLSDLLSNGNGNGKCYINGRAAVDRRRSLKRIKKVNGSHRLVFKSVLQSREISRSADQSDKPTSAYGSAENLSMRSSGTSELLDNVNPPSVMDDISMTNSCTSLNSINSDILESRSQSLADPRSDSEMFQRLNAAAAMVQVYSRELSNIMTGSMKSSCNSDNLDQVKPPSVFQDIAEVTVEDGTEVCSDAMISDSELEEELPHDDEGSIPSTDTVHSPLHLLTRTEYIEGSSENLNSSVDGDSICTTEKTSMSTKRISGLALIPQNASVISISSNIVQHAKPKCPNIHVANEASQLNGNSNEPLSSPTPVRKGPRIVKPINRETIRQMQEKKSIEKPIRSIRGRVSSSSKNVVRTTNAKPTSLGKPSSNWKGTVSTVRPTRTSALRASQSQKQVDLRSGNGRLSPRSFLSKPPVSRTVSKPVNFNCIPISSGAIAAADIQDSQSAENQRPSPLVKQGTFTKDEPTVNAPAISPQSSGDLAKSQAAYSHQSDSTSPEQPTNFSDSCMGDTHVPETANTTAAKLINKKYPVNNSSGIKKSSSNYILKRNVSLPLQKKENTKMGLKPSPSNHSFDHDGVKFSGNSNTNSTTFSRGSLSSLSSNSLSLKRASSQKEVTSKISSIWKKSENSSSANSPVTDSSITERLVSAPGKAKQVPLKPQPTRSFNRNVSSSQDTPSRPWFSSKSEKIKPDAQLITNKPSVVPKILPTTSYASTTLRQPSSSFNDKKKNTFVRSQTLSQTKIVTRTGCSNVLSVNSKDPVSQSIHRSNFVFQRGTTINPQIPCSSTVTQEPLIMHSPGSDQRFELKTSPVSAVVPPFNYTPSSSKETNMKEESEEVEEKDMTGNEILDDDSENSESQVVNRKKYIVTTV